MGMTSFYQGSFRYDIHGRKRKTKSMSTKKAKPTFVPMKPTKTFAQQQMDDHREKYPSMPISSTYTPQKDESWKAEASKNFTVAPAYNKGAYQVIPRKDVEHIGK